MSTYRVVDATGRTLQVAQHDDVRSALAWGGQVDRDTWLQRWIEGRPGYWSTVFCPPGRATSGGAAGASTLDGALPGRAPRTGS